MHSINGESLFDFYFNISTSSSSGSSSGSSGDSSGSSGDCSGVYSSSGVMSVAIIPVNDPPVVYDTTTGKCSVVV